MAKAGIEFDAPDLAARVEQASPSDIDKLPFGVIHLDREGTVLLYSATEAKLSGYPGSPVGKNFFTLSRCMGSDDFRTRITRAMEQGPVDLEFGWSGDFSDPQRSLRLRVQSSHSGGVWIFVERD